MEYQFNQSIKIIGQKVTEWHNSSAQLHIGRKRSIDPVGDRGCCQECKSSDFIKNDFAIINCWCS